MAIVDVVCSCTDGIQCLLHSNEHRSGICPSFKTALIVNRKQVTTRHGKGHCYGRPNANASSMIGA